MSPKEYDAMFAPFPDQTIPSHPITLLPNPNLSIPFLDWLLIPAVAQSTQTANVCPLSKRNPKATDPGVHAPSPSSLRLGVQAPFSS